MAANQVGKNKKMYKNCPKAILNAVPKGITKVNFTDLTPGEDYEKKALIGKINHLYPLGKRADGDTRKILVVDEEGENVVLTGKPCFRCKAGFLEGLALDDSENNEKKLPVFLFDQYARDSEKTEIESYVIITNFIVQCNPNKKACDMPVQVLIKRNESEVWFGKKVNKEARKKSAAPNRSKKQKVSSDGEEAHAISALHYEYTKLGDLTESESYHNVYGIVDKCDLKVTQGSKKLKILDLLLIDETEASFSCSVFAGDEEIFPDVYPGDVVRVHRMQVYKFRNKLKGKCANPKFILVFSKHNEGDKPRTVAKTFTFEAEDLSRARQLLQWNKTKNDPKLICDIQKGDFVNIICQVVGVYVARTEAVILKIWDGTKTNEFTGVHLGFKEEKLDQRLFTIARSYYVNLFVYGHHIGPAAELEPGKYIEVRDAHLYTSNYNPEEAKLTLHSGNKEGRGIFVLNEEDERVLLLKERLEKIVSDVLVGSQTNDQLSQDNSMFLNFDISVFNSQPPVNRDHAGEHCEPEANQEISTENGANEEMPAENGANEEIPAENGANKERPAEAGANEEMPSEGRANEQIPTENNANEEVSSNLDLLNRPLNQDNTSQDKIVLSVVDVSIKPGQSTQEFGGMQREETGIPDEQNRMSVTSEPDPICNLTPLQTRYFFHDPQRSSSQMADSIFPTYISSSPDDEWWNSVPTVSVTDQHSDVKPTRIDKIVQHDAPSQFRVLAAVFCFKPNTSSIEKFINLCCSKCNYISEVIPPLVPFETRDDLPYYYCPVCKDIDDNPEQWPVLKYTFMLSLFLHDGSSCIETYLWKENAVKFFKGTTPEEALRDSATADSILHMLWNICPNCKPFNSTIIEHSTVYPTLDCCIFSYTSENETRYQIFDTILI